MTNNELEEIDLVDIDVKSELNTHNETLNIQQKINTQLLTNGWNNNNEQLCITIGENCASFKWMHEQSVLYYQFLNTFYNIILIIFTTGLSADITITQTDTNDIFRKIFIYIVNILTVIGNFIQLSSKIEKHQLAIKDYSKMYNDIKYQMCLYRRDRINAEKFLSNIIKKSDDLQIQSPTISYYILHKFKQKFNNNSIQVPNIADNIQKIDVITENSKEQPLQTTRSLKQNVGNLHNVVKIHDDILDNDTKNIPNDDLVKIQKNFVKKKIEYELNRFFQNDLI
jgi:hypothetical protein